jgi:hypothetical protein
MAGSRPEEIEPSPDSGRAKRDPPTIDLEATEVPGEQPNSAAEPEPAPSLEGSRNASLRSAVIGGAVSGACAAALVTALAWYLGGPGEFASQGALPAPAVSAAAVDDLAARIANVESKASKPAASPLDAAAAARIDALEKSVNAVRAELGGVRAESEKVGAAVNELKSVPRPSAPGPDLSDINERIAGLERAARAQSAALAQESAKPGDDVPLRRIVAAALLDVLVRTGDAYSPALATAKSLAPNPDLLKPLESFATSGVPSAAVLSRELLALVPKLSPRDEKAVAGSSLVDRLQAGAAKLVRIERTDAVGNERGNVVARATAAALRNDYNDARRELNTLASADRAPAQEWIEKTDARDRALAASRQFATDAMTALAKPAP